MDIVNYVRVTRSGEQPSETMTEEILREPWAQVFYRQPLTSEDAPADLRACPLCGAIIERGSVSLHGAYHLNETNE